MKRLILLVYLIFFSVFAIYGQDAEGNNLRPIESYVTKQYNIFFQSGISKIDYTYCNNSEILYSMKEDIEASLKVQHMLPDTILIRSTASPDGKADQNAVLAQERAAYTKDILLAMFPDLGKSNFVIEYKEESWDGLKQILKSDKDFPQGENMLEIIESDLDELSKEEALRNCKERQKIRSHKKCFRDFTYCKIGDFLNLTIRSLRACVCAHIVEGQHF